MLVDALTLPQDTVLETELCIVGAGPAGIAIACEFIGQPTSVCLLESGGLEPRADLEQLCETETIGQPCSIGPETRCRKFGGTSNFWCINIGGGQWGVRLAPLSAIDFEQRDWIAHSGWPFDRAALDPYYERAQKVCCAGPFAYQAEDWTTERSPVLPLAPETWRTHIYQFGLRDVYAHEYRQEIQQSPTITAYIHAHVLELETDDVGQHVTSVRVAASTGSTFQVKAKTFILAAGGVESAQLLLLSNRVQRAGLGNAHDLVGRFFMDHPKVYVGSWIPSHPRLIHQALLYDMRRVHASSIMGALTLSDKIAQQEHLLAISAMLFPRPKPYQAQATYALKTLLYELTQADEDSPAVGKVAVLKRIIKHLLTGRHRPDDIWKRVVTIASGLDYILPATYRTFKNKQPAMTGLGRGGWSVDQQAHRWFHDFEVLCMVEQEPDPSNRITLSSQRDPFGRLKPQLHWRLSDQMIQSILRSQDSLADAIAKAHLGELQILRDRDNLPVFESLGSHHHMGTTRMHPDPRQGVVDETCRVHGVDNLYIASSAVFPTGGHANPTLTIVALALRLADHVKQC